MTPDLAWLLPLLAVASLILAYALQAIWTAYRTPRPAPTSALHECEQALSEVRQDYDSVLRELAAVRVSLKRADARIAKLEGGAL